MGWSEVWSHQLRWARTIRVCQPVPFFFSILGNATLWPLVWVVISPGILSAAALVFFGAIRIYTAQANARKLAAFNAQPPPAWLVWLKDLGTVAIWVSAFMGNRVEWRKQSYRTLRDGRLAGPI
jgi:ceramide glucosyltransferase